MNALEQKDSDLQVSLDRALIDLFESEPRETLGSSVYRCIRKHVETWYPHSPLEQSEAINAQLLRLSLTFVTDALREFIVIRHAHGMTTASAVDELRITDSAILYLSQVEELDVNQLRERLIHNLSYLKPTSSRFPKKFMEIWLRARRAYKEAIKDIPLSSPVEQVASVTREIARLDGLLDSGISDTSELLKLIQTKARLLSTLNKMTTENAPSDLSVLNINPQIVAVLERLSIGIDAQDPDVVSQLTELLHSITSDAPKSLPNS